MNDITFNPYKSLQGKLPTRAEVALWPTDKFLDFFRFYCFFLEEKVSSGGTSDQTLIVTDLKRQRIEEYLEVPHHPYQEFLWRINCFILNPKTTSKMFSHRILSMYKLVGLYLQKTPSAITGEMRDMFVANPRFNWIIPKVTTEIVPTEELPVTDITTADVTMANTIIKTAALFDAIVTSINKRDINKMEMNDKIKALRALSFIYTQARQYKTENTIFANINIDKTSAEDLEKKILEISDNPE
jgi:hypothetical protein